MIRDQYERAGAGRAVPEWIGATPDTPIPKRVKDRIWLREGGRCYLTGRKIQIGDAFEFEHVIAITLGGENRFSATFSDENAHQVAWLIANAMAVTAGYTHLAAESQSQPFAPRIMQLGGDPEKGN